MCDGNLLFVLFISLTLAVIVKGQTCTCDLRGGICEVNCCCDVDCSTADVATFSQCIDTSYIINDQKCVADQVVFVNSLPSTVQVRQNGLFCIETDNFANRNNYISPECAASNTCFNFYNPTFTYDASLVTTTSTSSTAFYVSGDTIDTIYSGNFTGQFKIPLATVSNLCQESSPIQYLISQSNSCVRSITTLASECTSSLALQASSYFNGFKVSPTRAVFEAAINSSVFDDAQLLTVNATCFNGDCNSLPSYNSATNECTNVVTSVQYSFIVNGTNGIVSVSATILLGSITTASLPLSQEFGVSFSSFSTSNTITSERSGNPGYIVGKPVISAVFETLNRTFTMNSDPNVGFTLVKPDSTGLCSSTGGLRIPILFGQDISTGCKISYNSTTSCADIQLLAMQALSGSTFSANGNLYIAAFGNSDIQSLVQDPTTQDWVQVILDTLPPSVGTLVSPDGCSNILLGSHFQILFANIGSISSPQAKIIGVRMTYDTSQTLRFLCLSSNCDTTSQSIEIKSSVTFLDVSETPTTIFKQQPTIQARLPVDFFFPFRNSANLNLSSLSCLICSLLLSYYFCR